MTTTAIIPAGGSGQRMGLREAKQYLSLGGVPLLVRTLQPFQACPDIDHIVLSVPSEDTERVRRLASSYALTKVCAVAPGGATRQHSVRNGMAAAPASDILLVHDAARPFVTSDLIAQSVRAAADFGAAAVGLPASDTVKVCDPSGIVERTLDRQALWTVQTPQAFRRDLLEEAYRRAEEEGFLATDDAALVERLGYPVRMIPGFRGNIKITVPEDLALAEALLAGAKDKPMRVGNGYDSHRFVTDRPLILGGVHIPCDMGLQGHSDADALCHAVADALLGAMAAGDIGTHFPDTDAAYAGISSLILLGRVADTARRKGFAISSIDTTIILEKPKLRDWVPAMTANIASTLGIAADAVSIKAKTNEGMGFVGRREGVAVLATAVVRETA